MNEAPPSYEDSKDDDAFSRAKAQRLLDHLVALNADSLALNFPYLMDNALGRIHVR